MAEDPNTPPKNPFEEIVRPFIDLIKAPRALWGINLGYTIEGLVYFGILGYLSLHFSDFIFRGVENANEWAHNMVMVLTAGITITMFLLGFVADRVGVRSALLISFVLMLIGRVVMSAGPTLMGLEPAGVWSHLHLVTMVGIVLIVIGYGMYDPACYAGVRQFTTRKTAAMGYAMLYALMNLGGWLPTFAFFVRDDDYLGLGITGVFWIYTTLTAVALLITWVLLSKRTVEKTIAKARADDALLDEKDDKDEKESEESETQVTKEGAEASPKKVSVPAHLWLTFAAAAGIVIWKVPGAPGHITAAVLVLIPLVVVVLPGAIGTAVRTTLSKHPLADPRFFFFIFALIPVQTLFTYNWLILPAYISRSFEGWIGDYFEIASNANPLLIFVLVPIIASLTYKMPVYKMMVVGTTIMALPAFLMILGAHPWTLFPYIVIMTVGEAIWQPRFFQYAAEIAPEGRTGEYMGVARLPWFLTKVLVPLLYSGWMMDRYCPAEGARNTETMWLIFSLIAVSTPIMLVVAKGWMGKELEKKAS